MKALKCDFCKKFFEYMPLQPNSVKIYKRTPSGCETTHAKNESIRDICPDCIDKIEALVLDESMIDPTPDLEPPTENTGDAETFRV